MTYLEAVALGILEGATEFLPISSTAHLIIASRVFDIPPSTFLSSFIIAIQLGAIVSVVLLFARRVLAEPGRLIPLAVAFVPTAVVGAVAYPLLKHVLIENLTLVAWMLILGGVVFLLVERFHRVPDVPSEMTGGRAFVIGCAQALAIVPGVSRAGATILGGLFLGIPRTHIVEFSFLLAVPTMVAATGFDLWQSAALFQSAEWPLLAAGFVSALIASYVAINFLMRYVATHTFALFGVYRIILGFLILAFL